MGIFLWFLLRFYVPFTMSLGFQKEPACQAGDIKDAGLIPESGRSPEVTHSNILAWRIPWTEEPGGPQSIGLQTVGRGWSYLTCVYARIPWTEEPGRLQSTGSQRAGHNWVHAPHTQTHTHMHACTCMRVSRRLVG